MVFKTAASYVEALRGALRAQTNYFQSLENKDAFGTPSKEQAKAHDGPTKVSSSYPEPTAEATALKAAVAAIASLHGKISCDLAFAKREVAYGKLDASELSELVKLLRQTMLHIIGVSSVPDLFSSRSAARLESTCR